MDALSILCVVLGSLMIASRGPMIFAPAATLRFIDRLLSTDARIRGVAVALAPMAAALVALPLGEGKAAAILRVLGWIWVAAVLWLLVAPSSYRRFAGRVLGYFENSVDERIVRLIGVVAVAIGAALIYFGIYVA